MSVFEKNPLFLEIRFSNNLYFSQNLNVESIFHIRYFPIFNIFWNILKYSNKKLLADVDTYLLLSQSYLQRCKYGICVLDVIFEMGFLNEMVYKNNVWQTFHMHFEYFCICCKPGIWRYLTELLFYTENLNLKSIFHIIVKYSKWDYCQKLIIIIFLKLPQRDKPGISIFENKIVLF